MDLFGKLFSLKNLVFASGLFHFYEIPASIFLPQKHAWKEDISRLDPINRKIVEVMGGGITLAILGLGVVVMLNPKEIMSGSSLGSGLACFLGVLWTYRGLMQILVFAKSWPKGQVGRMSHYALVALFIFLSTVYFTAFVIAIRK